MGFFSPFALVGKLINERKFLTKRVRKGWKKFREKLSIRIPSPPFVLIFLLFFTFFSLSPRFRQKFSFTKIKKYFKKWTTKIRLKQNPTNSVGVFYTIRDFYVGVRKRSPRINEFKNQCGILKPASYFYFYKYSKYFNSLKMP